MNTRKNKTILTTLKYTVLMTMNEMERKKKKKEMKLLFKQ